MRPVGDPSEYRGNGVHDNYILGFGIREVFVGFPGLLAKDSRASAIRGTVCRKYATGWISYHRNGTFNTLRYVLRDVIRHYTATEQMRVAAGGLWIEVRYRRRSITPPLRDFVLSYPKRGLR